MHHPNPSGLGASGRSPTKKLSIVKQRVRVHGRRLSWLLGWHRSVDRSVWVVIRRSLNDFPFGRALCSPAIFRTMLVSEDGFDGLEIEWGTAAVDERLKHLFHVPAHLKDQVATVFDLIVGVLIMEPATLLFVEVEGKAHTGVNPTLADLAQSPYSPVLGQGVCDLRQTCGVRDRRKAVSFPGEGDARLARLAGNVFMTVQDHLGREGRMPANLDGQMAPVRIEDVKRVVVDIEPAPARAGGIGFFRSMWCFALTSHTGACARPTRTRNKPWVTLVLARYSSASSCLRCPGGQSITGMSWALAYPRMRRLNRPASRI